MIASLVPFSGLWSLDSGPSVEPKTQGQRPKTGLFNNPYQVRYFRDRPTHRRRIRPFDNLIELSQSEPSNDLLLVLGTSDHTAIVLDLDLRRDPLLLAFLLLSHVI